MTFQPPELLQRGILRAAGDVYRWGWVGWCLMTPLLVVCLCVEGYLDCCRTSPLTRRITPPYTHSFGIMLWTLVNRGEKPYGDMMHGEVGGCGLS